MGDSQEHKTNIKLARKLGRLVRKDNHESRLKLASLESKNATEVKLAALGGDSWVVEGGPNGVKSLFTSASDGFLLHDNNEPHKQQAQLNKKRKEIVMDDERYAEVLSPKDGPASPTKMNKKKPVANAAEKEGLYSMLTKDNTWQQVGKMESNHEKPASRRDILLLQKQFDRAMHTSQREIRLTRKIGTGLMAESRMEQDVVATKENVREMMKPMVDPWQLDCGLEDEAQGNQNRFAEVHATLSAALFEQKWTDLVFGELEDQILVSCLEQGKLLRKIRNQLATSFAMVCTAQSMIVHDLGEMTKLMLEYRAKAEQLTAEQDTIREELHVEHEQKMKEVEEATAVKFAEYEQEVRDAHVSEQRMSDTLTSLNAVYKKMREDADVLHAMELKDACSQLERRLEHAYRELEGLRPLVNDKKILLAENTQQSNEMEELRSQIAKLEQELDQREAMVQDLMQNHSVKLSKEELANDPANTGVSRASSGNQYEMVEEDEYEEIIVEEEIEVDDEDDLDEEEDNGEITTTKDGEPNNAEEEDGEEATESSKKKKTGTKKKAKKKKKIIKKKKIKRKKDDPAAKFIVGKKILKQDDTVQVTEGAIKFKPGSGAAEEIRSGMDEMSTAKTVLCPRCNAALDKAGNIDEKLLQQDKPRLACEGYRMLLPNLMGYRPERPRYWVLRCMRSIIKAKRVADFSADRVGKPRMRFPEFVYMWFTPRMDRLEEIKAQKGNEGVAFAKAEADENRWALYYGVKALSMELPEARVFYTFLDEKYGEDDFAFYIHCLTVMEAVANEKRSTFEWGFNTTACDYDAMTQINEEQGGEEDIEDFVFIEIKQAASAVERVMSRASPEDSKRAVKTLLENAVQEEIRITPTTGQRIIDINVCLRVLLQEYRDEQAHRRAALRLMFGCASAGPDEKQSTNKTVDLSQLTTIVTSLNSRAGPAEAVTLYRLASEIGEGKVTVDSFSKAADRSHFLTDCLRLPAHYGTEAPNQLSPAQCVQIGVNVRQQMALVRPLIENYKDLLDPHAKRTLNNLENDVEQELERGGVQLDGRRALCALRRLLYFVLGERNGKRELYGEQDKNGDVTVANVKREIESLTLILRDFAADEREERLQALQLKNSAALIQQRWRKRQEVAPGVPHDMRKMFSVCFDPGLILETDEESKKSTAKKRRLPRAPHQRLEIVLIFMDEVYRYKLYVDSIRMRNAKFMLGNGKTTAITNDLGFSRPHGIKLEEAIHSVAMRLFGVRVLAERFIHDFFVNVHKHAHANIRVRLFARFTGVRSPALQRARRMSALEPTEDEENTIDVENEVGYGLENDWSNEPMKRLLPKALHNPDAVDTYCAALSVFYEGDEHVPAPFLPPYADEEVDPRQISWVPLERAIHCIKTIFHGGSRTSPCGLSVSARVAEECMTRLERVDVERNGMVDLDRVLMIILQGWHSEQIYRRRALFEGFVDEHQYEDLPANKVAINRILSFPDFQEKCLPVVNNALTKMPISSMEMYRLALNSADPQEAIVTKDFHQALVEKRICAWAPLPSNQLYTTKVPSLEGPGVEERWKLLVNCWAPLETCINKTMKDLIFKLETPDNEIPRTPSLKETRNNKHEIDEDDQRYRERKAEFRNYLIYRLDETFKSFVDDYQQLLAAGQPGRTVDNVEDTWAKYRSFLSVLQQIRVELGLGHEPVKDQWDIDQLQGTFVMDHGEDSPNKKRRKTNRRKSAKK